MNLTDRKTPRLTHAAGDVFIYDENRFNTIAVITGEDRSIFRELASSHPRKVIRSIRKADLWRVPQMSDNGLLLLLVFQSIKWRKRKHG